MLQASYIEIEIDHVLMVVFPQFFAPITSFLKRDLKRKHSWLNVFSARDLVERVWHVVFACVLDRLHTSVCFLTRQFMPIGKSLQKVSIVF
jgi:hypothetical protein